ncbi:MAG: DnaJ domain-containing protein [Deltaproteobacteria bacterium]|nr:DnaJ domain-containing protein [Deltaproteobacteria bacterium]MBW1792816.1 DnaJ domain-containing protein [Deltaproteobacteria bacterium]MBW2329523.1 DnaJ domain-containing protein [Deltaproteobacteria bacterium]
MRLKSAYITKQRSKALKCINRKRGLCLACGENELPRGRRRYCSDKCKKRLEFALYIATGLVQTLRARYAAFSYTEDTLILDILPVGSSQISRFMWRRSKQKKVADDLLDMIEQAGREWYEMEEETSSRWWASQYLLDRTSRRDIPVSTVKPISKKTPQLNHKEKNALKVLELTKKQILAADAVQCVKSAYRRKAKLHHPDRGDTSNKFIEINEAHAELLNWAESPRFRSRTALVNSWCYDASRKRWVPPA